MMDKLMRLWLLGFALLLSSCELVEGIFKAGIWVGAIVVVLVLGAIVWIFSKFR